MHTITIVNHKGGVGKTATAVNLAAALGKRRKKVLVLDLDPQAHLTETFYPEAEAEDAPTLLGVFSGNVGLADVIRPSETKNVWVAPADLEMVILETQLQNTTYRHKILQFAMKDLRSDFDFALIDCPPSLNLLVLNALFASDSMIVPVEAHKSSTRGLVRILDLVREVRIEHAIHGLGILIAKHEHTGLHRRIADQLRSTTDGMDDFRLFKTMIRKNVDVAKADEQDMPVVNYRPKSHGAQDYMKLSLEVMRRCQSVL